MHISNQTLVISPLATKEPALTDAQVAGNAVVTLPQRARPAAGARENGVAATFAIAGTTAVLTGWLLWQLAAAFQVPTLFK